jgi:hypothetical protein
VRVSWLKPKNPWLVGLRLLGLARKWSAHVTRSPIVSALFEA